MKRIKAVLLHPFFQGTFLFTVLSFFSNILNYFFNLLLARVVSVSQYGEYASALSYIMLLTVPFGALSLIVIRRIGAVSKEDRAGYIHSLFFSFFYYAQKHFLPIGIGCVAFIAFLITFSNMSSASVAFIFAFFFISFFFTVFMATYQAEKKFLLAGGYLCLLSLVKVIGGGVAGVFNLHLYFLYSVILIAHLAVIFFSWRDVLKEKGKRPRGLVAPQLSTLIFKKEIYLPMLSFLGLVAMTNLDIMFAKRYFDADSAGLYAALSLLGRIILYVSLPLTSVAFSYFTGSDTKGSSTKILTLSIGILLLLGGCSIIGYTLLPTQVVHIIFGAKYNTIIPNVWMTAWFGVMYSLATLLGQYWVAQHYNIGLFSLVTAGLQAVLLFLFHGSFTIVLTISIACSALLFFVYLSAFFLLNKRSHVSL